MRASVRVDQLRAVEKVGQPRIDLPQHEHTNKSHTLGLVA
jgi:hypothetical protein